MAASRSAESRRCLLFATSNSSSLIETVSIMLDAVESNAARRRTDNHKTDSLISISTGNKQAALAATVASWIPAVLGATLQVI